MGGGGSLVRESQDSSILRKPPRAPAVWTKVLNRFGETAARNRSPTVAARLPSANPRHSRNPPKRLSTDRCILADVKLHRHQGGPSREPVRSHTPRRARRQRTRRARLSPAARRPARLRFQESEGRRSGRPVRRLPAAAGTGRGGLWRLGKTVFRFPPHAGQQ